MCHGNLQANNILLAHRKIEERNKHEALSIPTYDERQFSRSVGELLVYCTYILLTELTFDTNIERTI